MGTTPIHLDGPPQRADPDGPVRDDRVLDELLDSELAYDPLARGGFISHLAMSLVAARRLGASDEQLRAWFDEQADDGYLIERPEPSWLAGDVTELEEVGIDTVVRRELPDLIEAPLSQFFHAVIRLELALDARHPGQVANALYNLRAHGHPLPDPPGGAGDEPFASVVDRLRAHPDSRPGNMGDLRGTAAQPWFADALGRLSVDDALLDDLASFAIGSHLAIGDFTTLHMVTGTRAVRALADLLEQPDRDRLAARTAQALAAVAAVLLHGAPSVPAHAVSDPATGWHEIATAALASHDAHVVKLVYAARLEEAATADRRYRAAAARQVKSVA